MQFRYLPCILLLVLLCSFAFASSANNFSASFVVPDQDSDLVAALSALRCMSSTGQQTLRVPVIRSPSNIASTNATVSATILESDGDANSATFVNQGDGNYTYNYTFDSNGTYKFLFHITDANVSNALDVNEYVYVRDFDIRISFLANNSSYSAGDTVTIRNYAQNSDGNAFNDINGIVSIFNPNSSTLHSNQQLSGAGNGEYIYTLVAPSTTGTYSATSTFSCNSESDSNTSGRFTVLESSGSGSTTTTTTIFGSGGSGGGDSRGGGGGSATGSEGLKAIMRNFSIAPITVGEEAAAKVFVSHAIPIPQKFIVELQIIKGNTVDFYAAENLPVLESGKTFMLEFPQKWIPKFAGTYVVVINLLSEDKRIKFDSQTFRYEISGDLRYDLEVLCGQNTIPAGSVYDFNISAWNRGDYYDDIDLSWWVEDEKGQKYGLSSIPVAIERNETFSKSVFSFVPLEADAGTYFAKARLEFNGIERDAQCTFSVLSKKFFYLARISELEDKIKNLESEIPGYYQNESEKNLMQSTISNLKQNTQALREAVENAEYGDIESKLDSIEDNIKFMGELNKSREAALGFEEAVKFILTSLIIISAVLLINSVSPGILGRYTQSIFGEHPQKFTKGRRVHAENLFERAEKFLEGLLGLR